jgi:hypothetical protein
MADTTFTVAASVPDPLLAQRLVGSLQEAGLEAFSRPGGAASSAAFASAQPAFWDVLVESAGVERAAALVAEAQAELEREGDANARAAEEEELSGEAGPTPPR